MGAKVPFALSEDKYHEKLATTLDKMFENCKDCDIYTKCKNENAFCQYNTLRGDEYIPFYTREIHKYLSGDVNYKVRNGKIYYVLYVTIEGMRRDFNVHNLEKGKLDYVKINEQSSILEAWI